MQGFPNFRRGVVYLTREEYEALRERALGQYERLRAIVPNENEIVFAVTRDVYLEAMAVDTDPRTYLTAGFGRNGIYGLFNGIRICVVNEETDYSMFTPAVCGRVYYLGMQLEDVILIEDNHLYSLRCTEPDVMFVDTGLTVSFGEEQAAADVAVDAAATVLADIAVANDGITYTITPDFGQAVTAYATATVGTGAAGVTTTAGNMYIDNRFLEQMDIGQIIAQATRTTQEYHREKAKPKKEEELNPGDTKALDDFLSGFMRNAT